MRTAGVVAAALVSGALAVGAAGGCKQDESKSAEARKRQELAAQSQGRLQVDQSAVLPVDVRAGVQREYPGATVQNVTKQTLQDRTVHWQVDLTTKDGKHASREFDDKGKPVGE